MRVNIVPLTIREKQNVARLKKGKIKSPQTAMLKRGSALARFLADIILGRIAVFFCFSTFSLFSSLHQFALP